MKTPCLPLRHSLFSIGCGLVGLLLGPPAHAQLAIDWFTVDGVGGVSTGGVFAVRGTIGQPEAGVVATGGNFSVAGGFWSLLGTVPVSGAPSLAISSGAGSATISWPLPATGFLLEQTSFLTAPPPGIPWGPVSAASYQTNATHIFIQVPLPASSRFYRLWHP